MNAGFKRPTFLAVAMLTLVGCAANPTLSNEAQELADGQARGKEQLNDCLTETSIGAKSDACFDYSIRALGEEAVTQAKSHWESQVASLGPDGRLLAAVLTGDLDSARAAVAGGADVNRIISGEERYGSRSLRDSKTTLLALAAHEFDLAIMDLLMQQGADPGWKEDERTSDLVATMLLRSGNGRLVDGSRAEVTGVQIADLALKHGYSPNLKQLKDIQYMAEINDSNRYKGFDVGPVHHRLFAAAQKPARDALVAEEEALIREELQLAYQQEQVERQRVESMRQIGTQVCTERQTSIGAVTYLGYVEGLAPTKAQVRVSHAYMTNAPSISPGNFKPTILWDTLRDWRHCDFGLR